MLARRRLQEGAPAYPTVNDGCILLKCFLKRSFAEIAAIVQSCQDAGDLPATSNVELTSLITPRFTGLLICKQGTNAPGEGTDRRL